MVGDYVVSEWFVNSIYPIMEWLKENNIELDNVHETYCTAYGVSILANKLGWVTHVEFQSEELAVEFVLRWS
jgi:hypothetical protein